MREGPILTEPDAETVERPAPRRASSSGAEGSAVGAVLRAARVRQGLDLADAAAKLRIRCAYLQAIEEGQLDDLPGAAYAVGFVRAYAHYLGLDGDEVVARYRDEVTNLHDRTELNFPAPVPESRVPSGAILLISVFLGAAAYGGWYYLTIGNQRGLELIAEVPRQLTNVLWQEPAEDPWPAGVSGPLVAGEAPSPTEAYGSQPVAALEYAAPPSAEAPVTAMPTPAGSAGDGLGLAAEPTIEVAGGGPPQDAPAPPAGEDVAVMTAVPADSAAAGGDAGTGADMAGQEPAAAVDGGDDQTGADTAGSSATMTAGLATDAGRGPADRDAGDVGAGPAAPGQPAAADVASAVETPAVEQVAALAVSRETQEPAWGAAAIQPQTSEGAAGGARIFIHARQDSWVQVRDGDGGLVVTRMLRAGDRYEVPDRAGLTLLTGNAGAIEIFVDGRLAPPIGPGGAVRRDVALDAERLLAGTAITN